MTIKDEVYNDSLKIIEWLQRQAQEHEHEDSKYQVCNLTSMASACSLVERGEKCEYMVYKAASLKEKHDWVRWNGMTIDLTSVQFGEVIPSTHEHEGIGFVFGQSDWHESVETKTIEVNGKFFSERLSHLVTVENRILRTKLRECRKQQKSYRTSHKP